jgi:UDP-perosamine 4-acetyltransferase|tara:strand:- start:62 stop:691 length:630 start_codon:yes stop_codon:yes gene_type:complete
LERIVVLGGGGHARVLISLIRAVARYEISGILDPGLKKETMVVGIRVLGGNDLLSRQIKEGITLACIGVGSVGDNSKRTILYKTVKETGFSVPCLIHPQAIVKENEVNISEGVQVMAGAIIQAGSLIKENTIINTGAIIEHDCVIGKHVHISSGAVISGGVTIGDSIFIGAGAKIIQGIKIGNNSVVAAGAVVISDVGDGLKVKGVPAE